MHTNFPDHIPSIASSYYCIHSSFLHFFIDCLSELEKQFFFLNKRFRVCSDRWSIEIGRRGEQAGKGLDSITAKVAKIDLIL